MRKWKKYVGENFLLEVCLLFFAFRSFALSSGESLQYSARNWQIEDGLPHNSVSAILQASDGYLWIGTEQGLVRFDGLRFTTAGPPELGAQPIRFLYQAKDKTLWIGPEKGGLICYRDGKFISSPLGAGRQVKVLFESRDGSLWIGTANGLVRYHDGKETRFSKTDGLLSDVVLAICEDQEGGLWIGTNSGLMHYKEKFTRSHLDYDHVIRKLFCDQHNNLWIGTGGGGVFRLHKGEFTSFTKRHGLPDDLVLTILEDSAGELWVGTMSGLCRRRNEKFVMETSSGPYETIFCLTEDNENNLWLGTKEGLSQLQSKPFKSYTRSQGLAHNNVMSVCEDTQGILWVATWGGGLSRLRRGEFVTYNRANSDLCDQVLSMTQTRDGSLWIGGDYECGLFQFKDRTFTHYGKEHGIMDSAVRVIYQDRPGNLWIGTRTALYMMQEGKFRRFTHSDGLAGNTIRVISEDHEGNVWIGANEGLTRIRKSEAGGRRQETEGKNQNMEFTSYTTRDGLSHNTVLALHEDRERNLWIGTGGGGLCRFSKVVGGDGVFTFHVSRFTVRDGLFSDNIFEILEDDRGNFWMSCFSGVFRVAKKEIDDFDQGKIQTISCASFGKADGMSSVQCNGVAKPAGWKGNDGRLWFPTTRGVVVVDPGSVKENDSPPPIVIKEVMADRKQISESVNQRVSEGADHSFTASTTHPLFIPPGRGELEFHYTALSFRAPEKNRFKYKLKGVDPDWVDAGIRRVAYYNNIGPGNYTFHVIGCNNDGVWNLLGANVNFILQPHYWQTWWFRSFVIVASLFLVGTAVRYTTKKRMQLKLERLEQQHAIEKERTRIAQDMHDDLGACLTEIKLLSGFIKNNKTRSLEVETCIGRIENTAEEVVRNLDGIVWAVNPANDSLPRLASYLQEYVTLFLRSASIQHRFDFPEKLPEIALSSEVRHNFFLVVKEALNNLVKHSAASLVTLRLQIQDSTLSLVVEDNGKGFSASDPGGLGNGLKNMGKRMESIGGAFTLETAPGKGTRLRLEIPLRG